MARLIWPNQDPIGRTFLIGDFVRAEVVGVAGDVKVRGLREAALPQAYFPLALVLGGDAAKVLSVKAAGDARALLPAIRGHLRAMDSTLALSRVRTMDDVQSDGMASTTVQTWLLGVFAAVAATLTAVGLYSVLGFLVVQRRHELGIRIALGAGGGELLRMVLTRATVIVATGLVVGLGAALWLGRLLRGLLFGVAANDAATFAAVLALVVLIAAAASILPARRAMTVDPIAALRQE